MSIEPLPTVRRPSQAQRERTIRVLRGFAGDGTLSMGTFEQRLGLALEARNRGELDALVADLPKRQVGTHFLLRTVSRIATLRGQLRDTWRTEQLPALLLPPAGVDRVVIGRVPGVDLLLADLTVSRRHAELVRDEGRWLVRDFGSSNGTKVNGVRVLRSAIVGVGDVLAFGRARFRLAAQ